MLPNPQLQTNQTNNGPCHPLTSISKLSKQFLKGLYESKCSGTHINPVLQILAFQESFHQPHSQIILRLSDGTVFVDCSLIGHYYISNNKITSVDSSVEFNQRDLVRLTDYFSKIDSRRICQLRIMIIRMQLAEKMSSRIGYPSQLMQYFENLRESRVVPGMNTTSTQNNQVNKKNSTRQKQIIKIQEDIVNDMNHQGTIKQKITKSQAQNRSYENVKNTLDSQPNIQLTKKIDKQQPLTYQQILQGKEGFFLGRLLRMKMAHKETKEGPMSVLYLGFIDRVGELVRVNMAGRLAMKEERVLQKGKCYYIKDLEIYQTQKMIQPQLRLKDKQYKILEVQQLSLTQKFAKSYFHWQHESESPEVDNVDIIGIIDDISEKKIYPNSSEKRQVVRVTVRNKYKTVQINFWAQQIKTLTSLKLKKRELVILEDIKKKKNIFLDYQHESSVIKLEQNSLLKQELKDFLPDTLDPNGQPRNIQEFSEIYENEDNPNRTRTFRVFLSRMQENRIIYKLCNYCRKKVQRFTDICFECNRNEFYFKYNCHLEFADYTGSINCVAFQFSAQRLLGSTANQISQMDSEGQSNLIDQHLFRQYEIGIQNRECRFIVRNVEIVDNAKAYIKISRNNIDEIRKIISTRKGN